MRLAAAFLAVALAAIALLAVLTLLESRSQVSTLVQRQHDQTATSVAAALSQAYEQSKSWTTADLRPALVLAAAEGASLELHDAAGVLVAAPGPPMAELMARMHGTPVGGLGPPRTVAIRAADTNAGTAVLRFPAQALPAPERQVRDALARTVLIGAGLAALLALAAATLVARWITRPLLALRSAAGRMAVGDRSARANLTASGELGELGSAFDQVADALGREDALRRAVVADVAHELRTPLAILQSHCEEMVDGEVAPTPALLRSLHDEILRLGRIVGDLEALAAAEAAALELRRGPIDLAGVAGEAADLLAQRFATAELQLARRLEPVIVEGDPARLKQVITNLLTNALKFTPPRGTVTIAVQASDSLAQLTVADTGPGIPAEELPHVFERFWRGHAAEGTEGSGIGLAVVAELVRAHHGRVEARSEPGEGTVFTVLLPRV